MVARTRIEAATLLSPTVLSGFDRILSNCQLFRNSIECLRRKIAILNVASVAMAIKLTKRRLSDNLIDRYECLQPVGNHI